MEKHRERNREHAKRTRLRKKAILDGMKVKLLGLQRESIRLQILTDERDTANILLAISSMDSTSSFLSNDTLLPENDDTSSVVSGGDIIGQLKLSVKEEIHHQNAHHDHLLKRIRRDSSFSLEENEVNIDEMGAEIDAWDSDHEDIDMDHTYQPLPQSTVNWKTSTVVNAQGLVRCLTDAEMCQYRKERNRMHAQNTRDRKKLFTSRMQKLITALETKNAKFVAAGI